MRLLRLRRGLLLLGAVGRGHDEVVGLLLEAAVELPVVRGRGLAVVHLSMLRVVRGMGWMRGSVGLGDVGASFVFLM